MRSSRTETRGTEHETLSHRQGICNILNKTKRFTTTVCRVSLLPDPLSLARCQGRAGRSSEHQLEGVGEWPELGLRSGGASCAAPSTSH